MKWTWPRTLALLALALAAAAPPLTYLAMPCPWQPCPTARILPAGDGARAPAPPGSGTLEEVPPPLPVREGIRVRSSWPTPEPVALPRD